MKEAIYKILKIVAWVIMVPLICIVYVITLLACQRIDEVSQWSWLLSLTVVAIFTLGVAMRNKMPGGVTVATLLATMINLLISFTAYSYTF